MPLWVAFRTARVGFTWRRKFNAETEALSEPGRFKAWPSRVAKALHMLF